MKKVSSLLVAATCLSATAAFADHQFIGSFEDMVAACKNPSQFHNQIKPAKIQISCKDVQYKWAQDTGTMQPLDTSRTMTIQLNSDKYTSNAELAALPIDPQMVGCPAFKQVIDTVETVRDVTCDDLENFQGTAAQFCEQTIGMLVQQNSQAINRTETGRTFNMCLPQAPTQQKGAEQTILPALPVKQSADQSCQAAQDSGKHRHHHLRNLFK
jgi:hypothetical protein